MSDSRSNSDKLRDEHAAFANVALPTDRAEDLTGGELPFIVAVVDDFSGNAPSAARPELADRAFEKVTRYTLDARMADIGPGVTFAVTNTLPPELGGSDEPLPVRLQFNKMDDFEPRAIARQVPPLARLLQLREQLVNLRARASVDPTVRKELEAVIAGLVAGE